jgi:hypothetical protein
MPYTLVPSAEIDSSSQPNILSSPCQSNRCGTASPSFSHRVGRVLSFFSSRRNWDSPPPHSRRRVCPPPFGGGEGTLACGRGVGGVPIPTKGHTLWCSVYISTLCLQLNRANPLAFNFLCLHLCRYYSEGGGDGEDLVWRCVNVSRVLCVNGGWQVQQLTFPFVCSILFVLRTFVRRDRGSTQNKYPTANFTCLNWIKYHKKMALISESLL